ncbi:hypothetical protein JP09_002030 [Dehalogenimonas etheniformans]|uniref:Uncharacterized protein n=1 Tax=Dehalogenimonas etheniformans TaxID=1536648 RepID=A0A2P5P8Q6_9CHLR|nr:hypothetical protein JP09_002030 [Dehalogenimonas etheniformans]
MIEPNNDDSVQQFDISTLIGVDLNDFSDIEILEIFFGLHTNINDGQALARICERRFGSLNNLVKASPKALARIGMPWQAILAIKFINLIQRRVNLPSELNRVDVNGLINSIN